jgi:integrase/recombinase XerD
MKQIRWSLYARVAHCELARQWLEIQRKLLCAPKTIDAYARGLDDYLAVCERLGVPFVSATRGDVASYVEDMRARTVQRHQQRLQGTGRLSQ